MYDAIEDHLGIYFTNDYIDTLRLARKTLSQLKHHKLDDLIDYFNLKQRNQHRALNDCILTYQVYKKLSQYLEDDIFCEKKRKESLADDTLFQSYFN